MEYVFDSKLDMSYGLELISGSSNYKSNFGLIDRMNSTEGSQRWGSIQRTFYIVLNQLLIMK